MNLLDLFLNTLKNVPDKTALESYNSNFEKVSLTYSQVNIVASQIKFFIEGIRENKKSKFGCKDDTKTQQNICLFFLPMVVQPCIILGVLMTSSFYSFINPTNPEISILNFFKNTSPDMIITEKYFLDKAKKVLEQFDASFEVNELSVSVFNGNKLSLYMIQIRRYSSKLSTCFDSKIAFLMSTSGTCGNSKLVYVPNQCILPNVLQLKKVFGMTEDDKIPAISSLNFDLSVIELFVVFASAATLIILSNTVHKTPALAYKVLFEIAEVTVLQLTPSYLQQLDSFLVQNKLTLNNSQIRLMALGGEVFPSYIVIKKWIQTTRFHKKPISFINLYGITEVSCWATYHEITISELEENKSIPLGVPLAHTYLGILDMNVQVVVVKTTQENRPILDIYLLRNYISKLQFKENCLKIKGMLTVGGRLRQCYIQENDNQDDVGLYNQIENENIKSISSGDIVLLTLKVKQEDLQENESEWIKVSSNFSNFRLEYIGRKDEQVKRNGKRINLCYIKRQLEGLSFVSLAYVDLIENNLSKNKQLVAFITSSQQLENHQIVTRIRSLILDLLPSHCIPDQFVVLKQFPLNKHDKICRKSILESYKEMLNSEPVSNLEKSSESMFDFLLRIWTSELGSRTLSPCLKNLDKILQSNFLKLGGDSLSALRLLNNIERNICKGKNITGLLDVILSKKFCDVLHFLENLSDNTTLNQSESLRITTKYLPVKNESNLYNSKNLDDYCSYSRGSRIIRNDKKQLPVDEVLNIKELVLNQEWSLNTGKCVDASPLVVTLNGRTSIIIGSHSRNIFRVCKESGKVIWKTQLGGRIESSGCYVHLNKTIVVGSYDKKLYILNYENGSIEWEFTTGAEVKSSPCVQPTTSLVYAASHDGHLYCLDVQMKSNIWKIFTGGSIFSSPHLYEILDSNESKCLGVYIANLTNQILLINALNGNEIWSTLLPKPLFSSPSPSTSGVLIGCVDNEMYFLSHQNGSILWSYSSQKPIFSSPCVFRSSSSELVLFGSHDGFLYCLNCKTGNLIWKRLISKDAAVYSSAYCENILIQQSQIHVVATASSDGWLFIGNIVDGECLSKVKLPGQVFSSPVLIQTSDSINVFIGCRDNYLYNYKISINQC